MDLYLARLTAEISPASDLPGVYRGAIFIFILLLVAAVIYLMVRNRRLGRDIGAAMIEAEEQIRDLDRCQIDNLPVVADALRGREHGALQSAAERMKDDAERLYQGKWISAPEQYLTADELLTPAQSVQLSFEMPLQMLALGVVGTAVSMLVALNFSGGARTIGLQYGLLPALIALLGATFMAVQVYRLKHSLGIQGKSLATSIRRRVPVFEELSGTAALIESFVRYDREMADSVHRLTGTVDDLSKNKMVELISENLSDTLRRELAPPLRDSQQSLGLLARELTAYQAEGIERMAGAFIRELGDGLTDYLRPLSDKLAQLTEQLEAHYDDLFEAQQVMDAYRAQSSALQKELNDTLRALRENRDAWQQDLSEQRAVEQQLTETLSTIQEYQDGTRLALHENLERLSDAMAQYQVTLGRHTDAMTALGSDTDTTITRFADSQQQWLRDMDDMMDDMQAIHKQLEDQGQTMSSSQQQVADQLKALNETLEQSVLTFGQAVHGQVDETLSAFDEGLADIGQRLAETTADIRDTIDRMKGGRPAAPARDTARSDADNPSED